MITSYELGEWQEFYRWEAEEEAAARDGRSGRKVNTRGL
jgi:hypothetical protein